ncbi:dnaJ homolog subfamily C member 22-like [Harmonia axyridis]|uniref:dnaJ homolog subfamily C member 22-like n=1 Tax=Harmonia axyridis TaxID=115357 RepID=UPI001E2792EF|nr:dnaJ homolog subfamily C member 22-like [Harmonia axyridis]
METLTLLRRGSNCQKNVANRKFPKRKSTVKAYACWFFGGIFGLHLFYLERDSQAFLTWSTFGGYGIGWLTDVTKIPDYVKEYNEDPKYMKDLAFRIRNNKKPPSSFTRFISALMVGYLWGKLVLIAIPEEAVGGIDWSFMHWSVPFAVALGVWVVGNIGHQQGGIWPTIIVSYLSFISRWYCLDSSTWRTIVAFCAVEAFNWFSKEWRRKPRKPQTFTKRITTLALCATLYIALWTSSFYFNGKIIDDNGNEIPVHEAVHQFFSSPLWTDFKQALVDVYQYAQHHGWYEIWKQVMELTDPRKEHEAYQILGLSPNASQSEISAKFRSLSRVYHPDKVKDPKRRREAEERFMEIKQAYDILSDMKKRRLKKNKEPVV